MHGIRRLNDSTHLTIQVSTRLDSSPVFVVYSAVMASSGILFTRDSTTLAVEKDRRLSFILKVLEECSQTHSLAREARLKLQANIDGMTSVATDISVPELSFQMDGEQHLGDSSMCQIDESLFDFGAFDLGSLEAPELYSSTAQTHHRALRLLLIMA
jgi:hypothetical protein